MFLVFCCPQTLNKRVGEGEGERGREREREREGEGEREPSMLLAMKMPLAEEQLVRGQQQQDVHKMPDERQAPQNRGLPPGN